MSDELKPFLYALMRPNGQPEISGECVAEYEHVLDDAANEQNCTVVPLYTRDEPVRKVTDETVEELSKLFHEANNYRGSWDGPDCPFKNSIRVGMRAAIERGRETLWNDAGDG